MSGIKQCRKILKVKKEILNNILRKAKQSNIEICGLLFGTVRYNVFNALSYAIIRNIENSPTSFKMDPKEMFYEIIKHREKSMDIVGLFHSHTTSTSPSAKDLYYMKLWNVPWLIVNSYGDFSAYLIEANILCAIKIIVTD